MAILDRPLFQRRPTRDELMAYGLPAFANGGIVYANTGGLQMQSTELKSGGKVPGRKYYNKETKQWEEYQPEPETALTNLVPSITTEQLQSGGRLPEVAVTEETTTTEETTPEEETTTTTEEEIKQEGNGEIKMDDSRLALERFKNKSDFYKSILAKYGEDDMRTQGFLQLAQFGLNLMSQAGGNFLDKVAKSAQDPLKAFAQIAAENTQTQKEIDVLALKQIEDEIATERQNEFELRLQAIKESGKSDENNLKEMRKTLKEFFPDKYPDTPEGNKRLSEDALTYVEFSPQDTVTETANNWKSQILGDVNNEAWYELIRDKEGNVDLNKVEALSIKLAGSTPPTKGAQSAVASGADAIDLTGMTLEDE